MKRINKILFVVIILYLCSGCTINYNLVINDKNIIESIEVNDNFIDGRNSNDILNNYNYWIPVYDNIDNLSLITDSDDAGSKVEGIEYHEKSIMQIDNGYYYTYNYTYPIDRFSHANSLRMAFGNPSFYDGGNYINIRTNNENGLCNYNYFESLKVNIKVDLSRYKVRQSNAHVIDGNIYTWNLNRNNCNNSIISLTLDRIKSNNSNNSNTITTAKNSGSSGNNNNTNSGVFTTSRNGNQNFIDENFTNYILYIMIGLIVLVVIFGYISFNIKKNSSNRMDD